MKANLESHVGNQLEASLGKWGPNWGQVGDKWACWVKMGPDGAKLRKSDLSPILKLEA